MRETPATAPSNIWSDPLSVSRWARYFRERRETTKARLAWMAKRGAALEFAGRFQIRSSDWPASYWADQRHLLPIDPDCADGLSTSPDDPENP